MATYTHTFPSALVAEMVEAFCLEGGYDQLNEMGQVAPEDMPTKVEFAKEVLGSYPKTVLLKYRRKVRRDAERAAIAAASSSSTDQADIESLTLT